MPSPDLPLGPRSATPKVDQGKDGEEKEPNYGKQRGGDHSVNIRHRLSLRSYPRDCPQVNVQWFHAVDIPKRKPRLGPTSEEQAQPPESLPKPKKFVTFSKGDTRAIEAKFQKLAEDAEALERERQAFGYTEDVTTPSQEDALHGKVPVNEDFLFDVNIDQRELAPAYWLGPVYEVIRGVWFYQEGARQRPCDENLAAQLEEGYLKIKPWKFPPPPDPKAPQTKSRPTSLKADDEVARALKQASRPATTRSSSQDSIKSQGRSSSAERARQAAGAVATTDIPPKTHRLFGAHMNSLVTYQNANTAWLLTDDFLSRMSSTVYQRFAGGGHFAGVKLTRGYAETKKEPKPVKPTDGAASTSASEAEDSDTEAARKEKDDAEPQDEDGVASPSELRRRTLERQMSSIVTVAGSEDPKQQEEEVRRQQEKEMREDYRDAGDDQGRTIEHLLLVTHGIGQRLGLRMESVNFVHDVNTLRKTMKSVYAGSEDLQALNGELDRLPKNCRVQVLPICWRHLLDFPKQSLRHNRKELDLADLDAEEQDYPSLDDITVEGVPAVRNLLTDLALDILLYQSPAYRIHISRIVQQECNRIYNLFKLRNPEFKGKVSLVGHSLGSAIMFDLLCKQHEPKTVSDGRRRGEKKHAADDGLKLDFDVEDFYALGSPIGLFQMLKGRTIAARQSPVTPVETPGDPLDDPFITSPVAPGMKTHPLENFDLTTSSPKCTQLFNIFHPTDPISYRMEPLISPEMSGLKPQPLPYTKRGIFGAPVTQGLTGIGQRVGQSVTGFWSSFSSGIASSLLNRSLGITGEEGKPPASIVQKGRARTGSLGPPIQLNPQVTIDKGEEGQHPSTLLDTEIETLYAGFQKRRASQVGEEKPTLEEKNADWAELEERSRKLKREEAKVRLLNSNGRVDYSIQEGAFDISLIASIASHLSYWADEDVSHFMISQLLARHRVLHKRGEKTPIPTPVVERDLGDITQA